MRISSPLVVRTEMGIGDGPTTRMSADSFDHFHRCFMVRGDKPMASSKWGRTGWRINWRSSGVVYMQTKI